ncbi:MAG: bacillithiol biosynthesis deacetylase BshB1 [Phycisphaerae bacterium]|nr:MAG: bacillithiol biosynthesis deacetylase BshB1 [Phycisphaerae bacterium]
MNVLVIAAHPDDAEIGMGGTIARLASQGHDVVICDLTDGSPTPRGERAERLREAAEALTHLQPTAGAGRVRRVLLDLPNRTLTASVAARHSVAGVIRAHRARVMFVPRPEDAHPDHVAATRIAEDARFDAKLTKVEMPAPPAPLGDGRGAVAEPPIYPTWVFYYDISHLRGVKSPDFCMDITGFEQRKLASVTAYRSQFGPWPDGPAGDPGKLVSTDFPSRMMAWAKMWGSTIGVEYAEPFYTREPLGLRSLDGVVM